nr:pyridoxal-phosphate dependent enzyme [Bacillus velezensis]
MKIVNSTAELIGGTPIVKLNRLQPEHAAQVYLKLESFNPSGSVKDRAAYNMIIEAENSGHLKPWLCHHRTDKRQHGHRPGDERGGARLQGNPRHA